MVMVMVIEFYSKRKPGNVPKQAGEANIQYWTPQSHVEINLLKKCIKEQYVHSI